MPSQKTSPFIVDEPLTISARNGAPGSQHCVRLQARTIEDLRNIRALPAFVDTEVVKRALEKVAKPDFAKAHAQLRLQHESDQLQSSNPAMAQQRTDAFNEARLAQLTVEAQVDGVVEAMDDRIARPVRTRVAVRAIELMRTGTYSVTSFELDRDMDVRAALIFDADIGMCRAQDIRVHAGAAIESRAQRFIVRARSFRGAWRSANAGAVNNGLNGDEGTKGGPGATGRKAVCQGVFGKDLIPTNGGTGGDAGDGGDGTNGGAGSDGGDLEQHLEVLVSGMNLDVSGVAGGHGGKGGKGGPGGKGGTGGDGNDCEPSGVGGKGGTGGKGGDGGNGGKGGDAGDLFIYYVSDQSAGQPPILTAAGGGGGAAGLSGVGGEAGLAGNQGPDSKYGKKRWDPGAPGGPGAVGLKGAPGAPGAPGRSKLPTLEAVPLV